MNKKGFVGDIAFWLVFVSLFAFVAVIVFNINSEIKTSVDADPTIVAEAKTQVNNIVSPMPAWIDSVMMFLFIGAAILLFFSVFLIGDFPGLFIFVWLFLGILIIIGAVLANAFEEFILDPQIAASAGSFTFLTFLMSIYPFVILFWGVSLALGLFVKNRL